MNKTELKKEYKKFCNNYSCSFLDDFFTLYLFEVKNGKMYFVNEDDFKNKNYYNNSDANTIANRIKSRLNIFHYLKSDYVDIKAKYLSYVIYNNKEITDEKVSEILKSYGMKEKKGLFDEMEKFNSYFNEKYDNVISNEIDNSINKIIKKHIKKSLL